MMIPHKPTALCFNIQKVTEDRFQAIFKQESKTPSILDFQHYNQGFHDYNLVPANKDQKLVTNGT